MNNLDEIREIFNLTLEDVANMLNIKKQSVSEWSKNNKIPEKRIKELSELLNVPEEYFQKNILEMDKIKLQNIKIQNDIEKSKFEYDLNVYDEVTGEFIKTVKTYDYKDIGLESIYIDNENKIRILNLLKKIDNISSQYIEYNEHNFYIAEDEEIYIEIFDRFTDIVDALKQDPTVLFYFLRALELTLSLGGKYTFNHNIKNNNKYIQQIVDIIENIKTEPIN